MLNLNLNKNPDVRKGKILHIILYISNTISLRSTISKESLYIFILHILFKIIISNNGYLEKSKRMRCRTVPL